MDQSIQHRKLGVSALALILASFSFVFTAKLSGKDKQKEQIKIIKEQQKILEKLQVASAKTVRQFHEVLDDLLVEFAKDVRRGQLKGLKNIAFRKITVNDALPPSYRQYVKLLVSERIQQNSKIKLINCIPCQSRRSKVVKGKLIITSSAGNLVDLRTAANQLGINNFLDVVLVYHPTHMVLAFEIFDIASKESIWTRTYNSETIKSRFRNLAIDYNQVIKEENEGKYKPNFRYLFGVGGSGIPNIGGTSEDSSHLGLHVRATERFDNRRSEFGLQLTAYSTLRSFIKEYPAVKGSGTASEENNEEQKNAADMTNPARPAAFTSALALYGIYATNFLGSVESYDELRQGLHLGIGGFVTGGYFAGLLRIGWDFFFGRRFALSFSTIIIAPSSVTVKNEQIPTKGGGGADVVFSFNY